ncbi:MULTISPECIES: DUF2062 domain-containing protein [Thermoactinomyces]|jgi:uncharacterized protein (DUF2062 family)|nr:MULTISPECIES: DUF2062 domain-containing protein [Thermoactinomyces]
MMKTKRKHNCIKRLGRTFRFNFLKLLRSPGGAKKVSLGFALGFGLEMIVIPTCSLIYILFYPIVRLCKGSLPAAIIGNIIGKLTFLPVIMLPVSKKLGEWIYPVNTGTMNFEDHSFTEIFSGNLQILWDILHGGLHVLIGQSILGALFGFISYFIIYRLYESRNFYKLLRNCS